MAISTRRLYDALVEERFVLPPQCIDVDVELKLNSAVVITYRCFLEGDQLIKLGRALARLGEPK